MNEIVIVGNGPTLLEKELGSKIDSFSTVVRFNGYTIENYEKHVGTKTDIWFNVINFTKKDTEWRMKQAYKKIVLHSWQWSPEKDLLYKSFIEFYKDKDVLIEKTKRDTCVELSKLVPEEKYFCFSTGLIGIWMLLKDYKKLSITGFDWWQSEKHHYNDRATRGTLHKPHIEKKVIDMFVEQGKIEFLT